MGVQSPMVFREQKRGKDSVNYYFEDAQTGELKVVTQFF